MSEKDIKVKPQTTTKAVKNAPKSVEHSAKQAVGDMAKGTLVKNITDKQLNTKHFEQPQRAEGEATEQVENTYYSAVDTVYQKGKNLAENKVKQHRQQVKTKENTNVPQNETVSDMSNTPKQAEHTPKTKERVQASAPENASKAAKQAAKQAKQATQKAAHRLQRQPQKRRLKLRSRSLKWLRRQPKPSSPHLPHSAAGRCFWSILLS